MSGLEFRTIGTGPRFGAALPNNFLPVALPALQNATGQGRFVIYSGTEDGKVSAAGVEDKDLIGTLAETQQRRVPAPPRFTFLGPRTPNVADVEVPRSERPPRFDRIKGVGRGPADIGIIDTGIAFWNPAFRRPSPRFTGMTFLTIGEKETARDTLNEVAIDAIADLARTSGDRAVHRQLAEDHPESIWAGHNGHPLLSPDGFSHGTAMAALAAEQVDGESRLFGLELPALAVTDASGDVVQGILALAIRRLVKLMDPDETGEKRIVTLLPFAFLGGPHDGEGFLTGQFSDVLASLSVFLDVEIIVPMGNHAEDRAHAVTSAEGTPLSLRLMPDDHSISTVECVFPTGVKTMALGTPEGEVATASLDVGVQSVLIGETVVGAIWVQAIDGKRLRARLSFAQTAGGPGLTALAGVWTLSFGGEGEVQAWILRDDHQLRGANLLPRRQARFEDANYKVLEARDLFESPVDLAQSTIRRVGSGSLLAQAGRRAVRIEEGEEEDPISTNVSAVAALWSPGGDLAEPGPSPYSGRLKGFEGEPVVVDTPRPGEGRLTIANGTLRKFRVSGTSAAAAIFAGRRAQRVEALDPATL